MTNSDVHSSGVEKPSSLEKKLLRILAKEDLTAKKALIEVSARHLKLDYLDLAAALLFLTEPAEILSQTEDQKLTIEKQKSYALIHAHMIRYRIEVGRIHKVTVNIIKEILIEEVGVERKKIGYVDIFEHYTVLSLPPGMPVDILQTFKDVEMSHKKLDIKRLSGIGKKYQAEKNYRRGTRRHYLSVNKKKPTPSST